MTNNEKLDIILNEVYDIKNEIGDMKNEISGIKEEMQDIKTDLQEVKQKVTKMDITLENEVRVNIQRVAEGHLDLSRKLDECIILSNDVKAKQEIQDIYINMHDSKLKAL